MNLKALYEKVKKLKEAIEQEYDLRKRKRLEDKCREIYEKLSEYIETAPF
jgi:hypothetical protein